MNQWQIEMLRQEAENREMLKRIQKELRYAPKGRLRMSYYRGARRYYWTGASGEGHEEYLGRGKEMLRDRLAQKKYDLKAQAALEEEQKLIAMVKSKPLQTMLEVYDSLPDDLKPLVEPLVLPDDEFVRRWLEEYSTGASGADFRSRIEIIYGKTYTELGIPFVYEPPLYLEGFGPVRPDFAVLNVRTRKMYYHEHLGKMDDPDYRVRNMRKLRAYHQNGFYEGVNLIITMESDSMMVDMEEVEGLIKQYLF